jgi:hypothetical protein
MNNVRRMRTGVFVAGASLLAAMLSVMTPAAQAAQAVSANDSWTSAARITSLPYHAKVDISQATTDSVNPPGTKRASAHSVWWYITPRKDGPILISTQGTNFHMHAALFRAAQKTAPDKWTRLGGFGAGKGGGAMVANVQSGKHYYLMLATHDGDNGGIAKLLVRTPATVTYSLARDGTYDRVDGSAVIHGTIRSTQPGTVVHISVRLRQLVGSQVVEGWGGVEVTVGKTLTNWQLRVSSGATFKAGAARVSSSNLRVVDHGARVGTFQFLPDAVVTLK